MTATSTFRVYYEDTDMAGVVYYANYLKFLERGRSDAVRDAGISQLDMKTAGLVFVVRRVEADYHKPARFDDILTVETGLEDMRGARFSMPQRVMRGDEVLLSARIDCAVMSLEGRPARLPAEIRHKLADFMQ
ncbi:tol-pal system-associated acyl-CoA thioesterase [Pontivivens insulae]|uniref:Acyl-CoA thioester hydrolase YbgC n=1 Tax=Pontivivens insulae TaxID=1639689 RepID=A0A2R8A8N2_9RHOB|nr:tol-pal system-associated acyl-CoA thioesterase [Pontivivens insulae]RED18681.1 acyl-CoA thioester hydrolase [Pontivivens insulae]SPF28579.1 Acyl-CoA thioester hydrolase YbgC [Pontivivens insulae]